MRFFPQKAFQRLTQCILFVFIGGNIFPSIGFLSVAAQQNALMRPTAPKSIQAPEILSVDTPITIQSDDHNTIRLFAQTPNNVQKKNTTFYNLWTDTHLTTNKDSLTLSLDPDTPLVYNFVIETHNQKLFTDKRDLHIGKTADLPHITLHTKSPKTLIPEWKYGWAHTDKDILKLQKEAESPELQDALEDFFAPKRDNEIKSTGETSNSSDSGLQTPDPRPSNLSETELDFFAPQEEPTNEQTSKNTVQNTVTGRDLSSKNNSNTDSQLPTPDSETKNKTDELQSKDPESDSGMNTNSKSQTPKEPDSLPPSPLSSVIRQLTSRIPTAHAQFSMDDFEILEEDDVFVAPLPSRPARHNTHNTQHTTQNAGVTDRDLSSNNNSNSSSASQNPPHTTNSGLELEIIEVEEEIFIPEPTPEPVTELKIIEEIPETTNQQVNEQTISEEKLNNQEDSDISPEKNSLSSLSRDPVTSSSPQTTFDIHSFIDSDDTTHEETIGQTTYRWYKVQLILTPQSTSPLSFPIDISLPITVYKSLLPDREKLNDATENFLTQVLLNNKNIQKEEENQDFTQAFTALASKDTLPQNNGHILVQTLLAHDHLPPKALPLFGNNEKGTETLINNTFVTQKQSNIHSDQKLETHFQNTENVTKSLSIETENKTIELTFVLQSDVPYIDGTYQHTHGDTKTFVRQDNTDMITYTQELHEDSPTLKEWIYAQSPNANTGSQYRWNVESQSPFKLISLADGRIKIKSGTTRIGYLQKLVYFTADGTQKTAPYAVDGSTLTIEINEPTEHYPLLIDPTLTLGQISSTERTINNTNKTNFPITCTVDAYDADDELTYAYSFDNDDWHTIGSETVDGSPTPYSGSYTGWVDFVSDTPSGYNGNGSKTLYCRVSDTSGTLDTTSFSITQNTSTDAVDPLTSVVLSSTDNQYIHATDIAYGDGADGAVSLSTGGTVNINTDIIASGRTTADGEAFSVDSLGANTITVTGSGTDGTAAAALSSSINNGDEVLLINLQGTSGDNGNVGKYEFCDVSSVSSSTITCADTLENSYGTGQKLIVQRVPNYTTFTLNASDTLTSTAWDGQLGGVVVFRVSGTADISGTLDVSGKGYRKNSNQALSSDPTIAAQNYGGEGSCGMPSSANRTQDCGGGGGGQFAGGHEQGKGGGGGAYANTGSDGGEGVFLDQDTQANKGLGGASYGNADLSTLFFGGAGGHSGSAYNSNAGGNGGGIIFLSAQTLSLSGNIYANGEDGTDDTANNEYNGGGGAGAGGSILIKGSTLTIGNPKITANGGTGGTGGDNAGMTAGNGGNGSDGRIALVFEEYVNGTTSPTHAQSSHKKYYFNAAAGEGSGQTLTLTAKTNAASAKWDCGSAFGVSGPGADTSSPYTQSYTVTTTPGDQTITCEFDSGNNGSVDGGSTIYLIEDSDGPTGGSINYSNGSQSTKAIAITVSRGSDTGSGLSSQDDDYLLEYRKASYAAGSCGAYGSWTDTDLSEQDTATSYTYTASDFDECYQFRYTVADYLGNETTYTSSNATKIVPANQTPDTPTLVSPADGTTTDDSTPTLSAQYSDPDNGDKGYTDYRISSGSAADCLNNTNIVDSGTSTLTSTSDEATTWTPESGLSDGTYQWCARNDDESVQSDWTTMGSLIINTQPELLEIISGNNQTGEMNTSLDQNLKVRVTTALGTPVEGVNVTFVFDQLPSNPAPQNHSLSAPTVSTDVDGYAETTLTLGDRAGDYSVVANFTDCTTPEVDRTFLATESEYFVMTTSETTGNFNLNPASVPSDSLTSTITIKTNAASFAISADPNTLPTRSGGTETIPNWTSWGWGWNNNSTQHTTTGFDGGGTGATTVFSCSGDSCQNNTTGIREEVTLTEKINYTIPAGVYQNTTKLDVTSLTF